MRQLTVADTVDNIAVVTDFVNEQLEVMECPMKAQIQIDIAIDELFGNIAQYAYHPEAGEANVCVEIVEDSMSVLITFIDQGMPYDPLSAVDPNTALPLEDRAAGGLGISWSRRAWTR